MGTVADKLTYLAGTKNAIKQAIIDKGVEIADTDTFRSYATKIADIRGGGGYNFPDITSIVESDTDNEYQYKCIWLLDGGSLYFDYSFGRYVQKVLLSDGTTYTASFKDHVWGTNTDTSITDYRYIILYMSENNSFPNSSFQTDRRPISITYNSVFLSERTDFYQMFFNCKSLQTIPLLDTSSGTSFSYMFSSCSSLQTIPLLDTSSGTSFYRMFMSCSSLQTIPLLDTSSGTNFSEMFASCYSLQTIPLLDTSGGENFSYTFRSCSTLKTIPLLDTSSGTNFNQMFFSCSTLQTIPSLNTSSGTNFSNMFYNCSSLQYLDTSNVSSLIFNYSIGFETCSYLARNTALEIINKLPTTTGQTIYFHATTLAKLTAVEKKIATNKGWTVSS